MANIVKKTTKTNNNNKEIFKKLLFIFILLQPVLDVLSNLYNNNYYSFNFVTYLKPLFVFGMFVYLFVFVKYKEKLKQFLYYLLLGIFILCHAFLLYYICIEPSVIFHELRIMINITYFITLAIIFITLIDVVSDKKKFYDEFRKVLILTICIYVFLYLLAVISGTSWKTYEFADAYKLGFRGWYFNGQIFGHVLCITLPLLIHWILNSKIKLYLKIIILILTTLPLFMIGTKVTFFIPIIVFILNILINLGYKIIHRKYKLNYIEIGFSLLVILSAIISFKYLPVYHNMYLNAEVKNEEIKEENVKELADKVNNKKTAKKDQEDKENNENISKMDAKRSTADIVYEEWTLNSIIKLNELYAKGVLHSAETRTRQLYFNAYLFNNASWPFKILGIGYINQPYQLSLERDIIMPFFSFGIIGFILFTGLIWFVLVKIIIFAIRNWKKIDIETILFVEALCMFICISYEAGYTFIYTQFSMTLAIIMGLTLTKLQLNKESSSKHEKK